MKCFGFCVVLIVFLWSLPATAEERLDVSFEKLDYLFGPKSSLTDYQKDLLWKEECKGKYVVWTGVVAAVVKPWLSDDLVVGFRHKKATVTSDVDVSFRKGYKNYFAGIDKGTRLTYVGRLKGKPGLLSGFTLDDGYLR